MTSDIKKRVTHRSRIIEGQFRALTKAIDEDRYCMEILTQSLAIQNSLKSLNKFVLESHMQTHLKEGMSKGSEKDKNRLIKEMLDLYELSSIRG